MYKIIHSGIINENQITKIENTKLLASLRNIVNTNADLRNNFEIYKKTLFFFYEEAIIDFFVSVLGYIVVYNNTVYFQNGVSTDLIDKISYVKNGFKLKKLNKLTLLNEKYVNTRKLANKECEKESFLHSTSEENELAFWYPRTANIGFKTPNTIITDFSSEEVEYMKKGELYKLDRASILERIKSCNTSLNLDDELFVRLGISSNKFDFSTCHINGVNELYPKLLQMLRDLYFKLEWQQNISLVLREFVQTNYKRPTIYNGMPLNTEFRVFYDFDNHTLLGIFNYWNTDTMLDNLHNEQDLLTFANSAYEIENHFKELKPLLESQVKQNLTKASLKGKWSIDFLFDGENFVLIDMAHAECSYYYDKVLTI